jgi:glutamine synthetase
LKNLRERLAADGVHTLLVQFTDLHGVAKGKLVPLAHLDSVLTDGAGFSGPSIRGTGLPRMGPRSEYMARGYASTLVPLPWMPGVARIVCDGFVAGEPFEACPRQVLRRAVARLAQQGWTLRVGIEPEFFLLKQVDGRWLPADDADRLDKPSYDLKSLPRQLPFLTELQQALQACGLDVLQLDHEDAQGQFEVNFAFADALASADHLMLFKLAAQVLAERHGALFSMMPKPFADQPGSGMHFHVSLWQGDGEDARCVFAPPRAEAQARPLSDLGRQFMAGVLAHSAGLSALAAPTVNSYKRLVVGETLSGTSWAPAYVAHGPNNRTALVRTLPGRFEWRLPDASANPYLAIAGLIAAGLEGVERGLDPGPDCNADLFALPLAAVRERGIRLLPQSLAEALDALEADTTLCAALGPLLSEEFIRLKRGEWLAHARHVSDWELQRYVAAF